MVSAVQVRSWVAPGEAADNSNCMVRSHVSWATQTRLDVAVEGICRYRSTAQVVKVEHTRFEVVVGARDSHTSLPQGPTGTQKVPVVTAAGSFRNSLLVQEVTGL